MHDLGHVSFAIFLQLFNVGFQSFNLLVLQNDLLFGHLKHVFELLNRELLVDLSLVLDLLGSLTELESRDCLLLIEDTGTTSDDQTRLGVTSEGLLQDTGKFGVPIGNMGGLTIGEGVDDQTEGCETLVDVLGLGQCLTSRSCLTDSLRTSKIDQVYLTGLGAKVSRVLLINLENKTGVGPTRLLVHIGGTDSPVLISNFKE